MLLSKIVKCLSIALDPLERVSRGRFTALTADIPASNRHVLALDMLPLAFSKHIIYAPVIVTYQSQD